MKSKLLSKILWSAFVIFGFYANSFAQNQAKKASLIIDKVVEAMGGMENYNNTRFIQWDFAKRKLYWDKWTGDVRVESPADTLVVLVNINTLKGKVFKNDTELTSEKTINEYLEKAKSWWINDSYWLVMPWKLNDPGVNVGFIKTDPLTDGSLADVLELTFNKVGLTPQNKYHLYVDQKDNLIKQWAFFKNFEDVTPKFIKPWDNYQQTGNILLSFNRSGFGPKNVAVKKEFDDKIFSQL